MNRVLLDVGYGCPVVPFIRGTRVKAVLQEMPAAIVEPVDVLRVAEVCPAVSRALRVLGGNEET